MKARLSGVTEVGEDGLDAGGDVLYLVEAELLIDGVDVVFHGPDANDQELGDGRVGLALGH